MCVTSSAPLCITVHVVLRPADMNKAPVARLQVVDASTRPVHGSYSVSGAKMPRAIIWVGSMVSR